MLIVPVDLQPLRHPAGQVARCVQMHMYLLHGQWLQLAVVAIAYHRDYSAFVIMLLYAYPQTRAEGLLPVTAATKTQQGMAYHTLM